MAHYLENANCVHIIFWYTFPFSCFSSSSFFVATITTTLSNSRSTTRSCAQFLLFVRIARSVSLAQSVRISLGFTKVTISSSNGTHNINFTSLYARISAKKEERERVRIRYSTGISYGKTFSESFCSHC